MLDKLKFLISGAWEFLKPIIILFATETGKQLAAIAIAAVKSAAAQSNLSGREKRDYAFQQIKSDMPKLGESAINLAIEVAVQRMK